MENSVVRQQERRACASEDAADFVRSLCRSALTGEQAAGRRPGLDETGWQSFEKILKDNRLWAACAAGFSASGLSMPSWFAQAAREERARAMLINSRTLATARWVFPLLTANSITAVVFKGPVFHRQLHGDHFFRRSNDLDLLVPREDFGAALEILQSRGFALKKGNDGRWWKDSLGELHLYHPDPSHSVIDLHHRIQQPGCPAPRNTEEFTAVPVMQDLGAEAVATLSPDKALILSCISLVKGLVHREASGKYAFDVAAGLMRLDAAERESFVAISRRQGLLNTVQLAIDATENLFRLELPFPHAARSRSSSAVPSMPFADMVLRPDHKPLEWPKRRSLLWAMCDGESKLSKAACFAQEAARAARGEWQRVSAAGS